MVSLVVDVTLESSVNSLAYVTVIIEAAYLYLFFFSSRRRHTRLQGDWSSDVCSSDLPRPRSRNTGRLSERVFTRKSLACCRARVNGPRIVAFLEATADLDQEAEQFRSEERRVGKECRSRWSPYH